MKEKKQATPIKGPPTKSKSKSNSFTQKINRVNQNKQQHQGMMEMKHLIQQMKEKKQATPIKGSPTKSNSFTQKINIVNQNKKQKQEMNNIANETNKNITEWVEKLIATNAEIQQQTTQNLQDKISQLEKQIDEKDDKTDETITEWVEELIATNAEIQQQTADENLERKIADLSVNVEENLDKLTKQIYTYIETINEENKKTNDTIVKNKTELKEEMETIKRDHHKDAENITHLFDKNNEFHTSLKKDLHHLSKQFYNSETDVEHEFRRITNLIKDKNSRIIQPQQSIVKSQSRSLSASSSDSDNRSTRTPAKNKDTPLLSSPLSVVVPSPSLSSIVSNEDKWEVENKTKGSKQSPTKLQGRTRIASPNFFSTPPGFTNDSSHHSENKTNPHSISRKNVRFTQKNKRSTNFKKGKRRTAKKNNTR